MVKIGSSEKKELIVAALADIIYATTYDERRVSNQLVQKGLLVRSPPVYGIATYKSTPLGDAVSSALLKTKG